MSENNILNRTSTRWDLDHIFISHNIIDYQSYEKQRSVNDSDLVRLHFGLQGSYDFHFAQLNTSFSLSGHHNNIMYTDGLDIEVENKTKRIETFGINFQREAFIQIGQNGNEPLKRLTDQVIKKKDAILSPIWKTNNLKIQEVIQEIIFCPYTDELKNLFLLSKSIELLVLQASLYDQEQSNTFIKTEKDKKKLIEAKEILEAKLENPPTIIELAKITGINEFKLKKGFKELFDCTIFEYIHNSRMSLARRLLLGSDKSAKEIAYETGYSSPQHFSTAFRKKFGVTPNSIRKNPDSAMD